MATKKDIKEIVWYNLNEILQVCIEVQLKKTNGFKGTEKIAKIIGKLKKELSKMIK